MPSRHLLHTVFALLALLPLGGCDTLGLGSTPPPAPRPLDYRGDDLGKLVFALDLPAGLQPIPRGNTAAFDVATAGQGSRHVRAALIFVDGDAIDGDLPPPATGRVYYLLGFSAKDLPPLAEAQGWLRAQPPSPPPDVRLSVLPKLCETAAVDPSTTLISLIPVMSGEPPLAPLIAARPLLAFTGGVQLPPCSSL